MTVTSVEDASPNVKLVTLRVHEREFSFDPGRVDFFGGGEAGDTPSSSPGSFARDGTFMAVRASRARVRALVHDVAKGQSARARRGKFSASLRTWRTRWCSWREA